MTTTTEILIAGVGSIGGIVVLGIVLVRGAEERGRRRSEKAMAAGGVHRRVTGADAELVEHLHTIVTEEREARTAELPVVRVPVRRRTVVRRPARWQQIRAARRRHTPGDFTADPLRAAAVTVPLEIPTVLATVPLDEPIWELESFTGQWNTGEFRALVEQAKAGARR